MKAGLVSVVLPIYNVEKYLDRCIKSVINQTYKNLEIILVDDGSPDRCPQMCDDWAKKDKRIKVIHKKNGGLGYARNTGIENASGEYICFFDSDDYIAIDAIQELYQCAKINNADIVCFGHSSVDKAGNIGQSFIPHPSKYVYEGKEVCESFLPDLIAPDSEKSTNLWMSVCGAFYSMNLIRRSNWRLVSERDIISEDVYSLLRLYKDVRKVEVLPKAFYFYCENDSSLTHVYKNNRYEMLKKFYNASISACDELRYNSEVRKRLAWPFISFTIAAMKMVVSSELSEKDKIIILKQIVCDNMLQEAVHSVSIKSRKRSQKIFINFIRKKLYLCCYCVIKYKRGRHS